MNRGLKIVSTGEMVQTSEVSITISLIKIRGCTLVPIRYVARIVAVTFTAWCNSEGEPYFLYSSPQQSSTAICAGVIMRSLISQVSLQS